MEHLIFEYGKGFLHWYKELQQLAQKSDASWVVSTQLNTHFDAYQKGLSPAEELAELDELAQWRGCGCGGGA
ncbi:MAG: hypothetical protein KBT88_01865 [Gammaproteobacteria bacterium]|nr:hypothetical protein [Gammaproteobacteria bacterium]MBQ0838504.1 hypothetical protein [Gammaproteobacteria bacterium]